MVGYAIPASVKYADALQLIRYLTLTFLVILLPVALLLSLFIRGELKPVQTLTRAAKLMGDGDLSHPLPSRQSGEVGALTQSFGKMRDLVHSELEARKQRAERGLKQQQALLTLSRSNLAKLEEPQAFLRLLTEQVERTLGCGRVSFWQFDEEREELFCCELYTAGHGHGRDERRLQLNDYPAYFAAILSGQPVVVEDVREDARTIAFVDNYLVPGQIQSMLDVPVRVAGETCGVLCIENVGQLRQWHEDDITFTAAVAEQIAQTLSQAETREATREISRLRRELANIVDSMPSVLIGVNQALEVRHWNREAEKATGRDLEQVQGKPLVEAFPQLKQQLDLLESALAGRQLQTRRKLPWHLNGRQVFVDLTVYPLLDDNEPGAVIRIDDVTERVQLEEMMVQTEKMLSVGGLAAGMAHEINNPLAGIMQNIQVIRNRFSEKLPRNIKIAQECGTEISTIAAYIEKRGMLSMFDSLTESGNRAARIVDNMLSFSRKSESRQAPHDLNDLISRTLALAANDYDLKQNYDFRKVKIVREHEDALPEVPCTATEIQQVLLNLLKNSAQAMAADPQCTAPQIRLRTGRDEDHALIELCDNGPGIPEEVRRRIFEPFFTTKGVGVGTGLGLSVSYFIVREKHHGSMEVDSKMGEGTCFFIRLPLRPAETGGEG